MKKEELDEYKYLWDKKEGWEVCANYYSQVSLKIVFKGNVPTIQEIAAVRKLLDSFQKIPVNEVKKEIGSVKELFIGEFSLNEARNLSEKAKKLRLSIIEKDTSFTSYFPFNPKTKMALLIEDEERSRFIIQKMIDSGIKISGFVEID